MLIFPAIDLFQGQAVRLFKGDYAQKTVYSDNPIEIAMDFASKGAKQIHIVDLEGAKDGTTPNLELICKIKQQTGLFCEVGGGIRNMQTVEKYLSRGIDRVILGTAAVLDQEFLSAAVAKYGEKIAVGIDVLDGFVAIKGWTEKTKETTYEFCAKMQQKGVKTIICTDISKDGAMKGTNRELYAELSKKLSIDIIASGGVSTIEDIKTLAEQNLYGAIVGKAYYIGAIELDKAIEVAK